jgi:hypothetical protein
MSKANVLAECNGIGYLDIKKVGQGDANQEVFPASLREDYILEGDSSEGECANRRSSGVEHGNRGF